MKLRTICLLAMAILATVGYMASLFSKDSLPGAADRLGKAILSQDTKTIWAMVPDNERELYGFDQAKFDAFWTKVVQPHLKNLDQYRIESENETGLSVVCQSSKTGDQGPEFSLLVSGQLGHYYVPYIVGYASLGTAKLDYKETSVRKSERFARYVKWIDDNEALLTSIGIAKIKRGPAFRPETLSEMKSHFQEISIAEKKLEDARLKVASR